MWPKNANGVGYPAAINRTDAWWLGPQLAAVGETISVFGRNLSNQNGTTTSWVYIKPPGYAGQWVTPTSVNPYQVSFTVPSLSTGSYEVWIHNGHGGHYGWSGPLTLTVWVRHAVDHHAVQREDRLRRATATACTDDTVAIESAMTGRRRLAVLHDLLPGGHLRDQRRVHLPNNIRWLGAGKTSTIVSAAPTSP